MAEYCKRTCLQAEKKHRQQSPSKRYLQWNPAWNVPVRTTAITKATIIAYKISQGINRPFRQLLKPLKAKRSQDKAKGANKLTNMPVRNKFGLMIPDGAFLHSLYDWGASICSRKIIDSNLGLNYLSSFSLFSVQSFLPRQIVD